MSTILSQMYNELRCQFFILTGKKPFSKGYPAYKDREIIKVIKNDSFSLKRLPKGFGYRVDERIIEYPWLLSRLKEQQELLLDAGSALNIDYILSHPVLESKKIFISTLAPEENCFWKRGISYIYQDLRSTCFQDEYFDSVASISTLEHIGLDNSRYIKSSKNGVEKTSGSYIEAVKEIHRILKVGGKLYITLPFGEYKNHSWFQIFNAEMIDELIGAFQPKSCIESHFRYQADGWKVSSREDSKNAQYFDYNTQKEFDENFTVAAGALVCLEFVK
ncbi:MAG: methyltransferase domain-containing protein [Nitrospinae bacterium]|nr:methyltransferase domain-containing protein [Nitrospinota bacterium]